MTAFVLAGGKGARRRWPKIQAALEPLFTAMTVVFAGERGQRAGLVREALRAGHSEILIVGGAINDAINGFFDGGGPVSPDSVLGYLGGDSETAIARMGKTTIRAVDVGKIHCLTPDGQPQTRYFLGSASFGLSGRIVEGLGRSRVAGLFAPRLAVAAHTGAGLLRWRDRPVRLISDNGLDEIATIASVMLTTRRDTGLFDIYLLPRSRQLFPDMKAIRDGRRLSGVRRARRLVAAPVAATKTAIMVEADGENLGLLPATFEILPQALNLRC